MSELAESFDVCDMLPDGYTALSVVVSIKALDLDGDVTICNIRSADLTGWEAIGMLTVHLDDIRAGCRQTDDE